MDSEHICIQSKMLQPEEETADASAALLQFTEAPFRLRTAFQKPHPDWRRQRRVWVWILVLSCNKFEPQTNCVKPRNP